MANFDTIRTAIDANITHNGNQEITGGVLNSVLTQMVDSTEENLEDLRTNTDGKLAELSGETDKKFIGVDTEIENLKRGEAYVMEESLVFRNYADAQIIGNTLTL